MSDDILIKLVDLCKTEPNFISIIRQIIAKTEDDSPVGWGFGEIKGWSGGQAAALIDMGFIVRRSVSAGQPYFKTAMPAQVIRDALSQHFPDTPVETNGRFTQLGLATRSCSPVPDAIDAESMKQFEALVAGNQDMVSYWAPFINPKIEGMLEVKSALLLVITSTGDLYGDRGRLHCLMEGKPGCAKSALQQWIAFKLGAVSCSQRTSKVGLTGDARGEQITPGALPRAHGGVICIDELDKFPHGDRQGLLESMEDGIVQIEVGGMSEKFPAECRVIASANNTTAFSPELIDRFDFRFNLQTPMGDVKKQAVNSIIMHWMKTKPGYEGEDLKKYLRWISPFMPNITDEAREQAIILMSMYIDFTEEDEKGIRAYEGVLRVAYARAKLNHQDMDIRDIFEAIRMINPTLNGGKKKSMEKLVVELEKPKQVEKS